MVGAVGLEPTQNLLMRQVKNLFSLPLKIAPLVRLRITRTAGNIKKYQIGDPDQI